MPSATFSGPAVAGALHHRRDGDVREACLQIGDGQFEGRRDHPVDSQAVAVGVEVRDVAVAADVEVGLVGEEGRPQAIERRLGVVGRLSVDDEAVLALEQAEHGVFVLRS